MPTVCEIIGKLKAKGISGYSGKTKGQMLTLLETGNAPKKAKAKPVKKVEKKVEKKVAPLKASGSARRVKAKDTDAGKVKAFLGRAETKTVSARVGNTRQEKPQEDPETVTKSNPYGLDRNAMNSMSPEQLFGMLPTVAKRVILDPKTTGVKVGAPLKAQILHEVELTVRGMKNASESITNFYKGKPFPNAIKTNFKRLLNYKQVGGSLEFLESEITKKLFIKEHPRKLANVFRTQSPDKIIPTIEKRITNLLFYRSPEGSGSNPEKFSLGMDYLKSRQNFYKTDVLSKAQEGVESRKTANAADKAVENEDAKAYIYQRYPDLGKGWSFSIHRFYEGPDGHYMSSFQYMFIVKSITKNGVSGVKLVKLGRGSDITRWQLSNMSQSWYDLRKGDLEFRPSTFKTNAMKLKPGIYTEAQLE